MGTRTRLLPLSAAWLALCLSTPAAMGRQRPTFPEPAEQAPTPLQTLDVSETTINVNGRTAHVFRATQPDGTWGIHGTRGSRLRVQLNNHTSLPITMHPHGLILPNSQDGVPFITQEPIPPGGNFTYDFVPVQSGTYFFHSHYGWEIQDQLVAPVILTEPSSRADAPPDVMMILSDFTFRSPPKIFEELRARAGSPVPAPKPGEPATPEPDRPWGKPGLEPLPTPRPPGDIPPDFPAERPGKAPTPPPPPDGKPSTPPMPSMPSMPSMPGMGAGGPDLTDVTYDAFLTNGRTLEDPAVTRIAPGTTVRLRIINASGATNFFIELGAMKGKLIAVDGSPIQPIDGSRFEIANAQRLDILAVTPADGAAHVIYATPEGSELRTGLVIAPPDAPIPALTSKAPRVLGAVGADYAQERMLRPMTPLPRRGVDRTVKAVLSGDMKAYQWFINGVTWENSAPLTVKKGERVELVLENKTGMSHPMHLHGHVFQVTEIDGVPLNGAVRDTVLVMPRSTVKVQFDADNPGLWMMHCHLLWHEAAGMLTDIEYEAVTRPPFYRRTEAFSKPSSLPQEPEQ